MDSTMLELLGTGIMTQRHLEYVYGASVVLAIVEYLACLPQEVSLIWFSEWTIGKALYFAARYVVFIPGAMSIFFTSANGPASPAQCKAQFAALTVPTIVGITMAEAILYLRVHALAKASRSRISGIFLALLFTALHVGMYVTLAEFVRSVKFVPSPMPEVLRCFLFLHNEKMLANTYILILISEILIMFMTLWVCVTRYKTSRNPLVALFYKDGLGYFIMIALISVGNILCHFVAPRSYVYLFAIPQAVLHGILTTRMVLHLRKVAQQSKLASRNSASEMSTIAVWTRQVTHVMTEA